MTAAGIKPMNIGVVGCGVISSIYLENCTSYSHLNVVAVADLDPARAQAQAARYNIPRAESVEDLLADPTIELVVNLTIPAAHAEVALAAVRAGKSVYNEKPLCVTREDARQLLKEAREHNVRVGCAPDTFMGGGLQTCLDVIESGAIGTHVAATAFVLGHGMEMWHPDPEFFYKPGAGPLFDLGPYNLTAFVALLGPVRRVTSSARITFPERVVGSEPKRGSVIKVETPTHIAGVLDFASGPIATLVTSFDVWASEMPRMEIYGSEGTISLPDPNGFAGPVRIKRAGADSWEDIPLTHGNTSNVRGIGVADMAESMRLGKPHRASGELAYHVLDIMHSILDASVEGRHIELQSTCERPAPMPRDAAHDR